MRILYLAQHFSGPSGSCGSRCYEHARRLVAWGHDVTLLCGRMDRSHQADVDLARAAGLDIHQGDIGYSQALSYSERLLAFRRYMRWAAATARTVPRPDVVLATSTPLTVGDVGRRVARFHRAPFVFEVRDLWPEIPISLGALKTPVLRWLARRMARRIYDAADRIIALSPGMARTIRDSWGIPGDRITVIPNCSDNALFGRPELRAGRDAFRERMGWSGKLVALHPGAMGLVNGLDYLVDTAALLDREGESGIRIVLLGDGTARPHIEARLRREGIRSLTVHPPVPRREIPAWLDASDVGLVTVAARPFLETNSANKFFDALAAGRPVLLNYGGWMAETLRESGAGMDADPLSPASMVAQLHTLRDDPARRSAMGRCARRLAEEQFDRDLLAHRLERVLVSVAVARSPEPAVRTHATVTASP